MSPDTLQSAIASIRSGDKETGKLSEVIRNGPEIRRRSYGYQQ
jgi:hypothetical protein